MVRLERQTITSTTLARIPRRPGSGAVAVRCRCGNIIGEVDGAWLHSRHKRRETVAALPAEIRCEACGAYTKVDNATN